MRGPGLGNKLDTCTSLMRKIKAQSETNLPHQKIASERVCTVFGVCVCGR